MKRLAGIQLIAKKQAIYRLFNPNARDAGSHHYTASQTEVQALLAAGWSSENIGWYGN
ncbi:hypothetical protein M2139_001581 [Enterococcus sp. PF1-24]|uniref:hypothetical protein n=1 Tax=unclassified Enterococcus TaxID=2608891 RepID=UPI002476A04F|nr:MULTISPECIES: hypothetical protein [unclassified Enterococcus]MDH6364594.1 hypothetical protein [Enterococcus sp. PFB1-1]MDH6401695.1 hypothetical protein [Enterococcus sp. PF1-24]